MEKKLAPREAELYRRCDEVLHYIWDPIGVCGFSAARDEYHSYLPQIFALVRDDADSSTIRDALVAYETGPMGLPGNSRRAETVAAVLLDWRETIWGANAV